jgi:hypothetical protein
MTRKAFRALQMAMEEVIAHASGLKTPGRLRRVPPPRVVVASPMEKEPVRPAPTRRASLQAQGSSRLHRPRLPEFKA